MKFRYCADLKEGYRLTMQLEEETTVNFEIEAINRATADRMVKALLKGPENIEMFLVVCIDEN